ncbi:MAG: peptide chain release factor N(5)-glutamine methyltransferase [Balneolaceae bacterium]
MNQPPKTWTVLSIIEWATQWFEEKSVPDPRLSIELLLAHVLQMKRLDLYLKFDRPLSPGELDRIRPLVKRRGLQEPVQYILGYTDFFNCRIEVDSRVLIPRVETEQMVALLLESTKMREDEPLHLLDIGTGSGNIPIAIASARPAWSCKGIDLNEDILELARKNARKNDTEVLFERIDLNELNETSFDAFDLIISNPPYILPDERREIEPQVVNYEPAMALFHQEPQLLYRKISEFASSMLRPRGSLWLECSHQLAELTLQVVRESLPDSHLKEDFEGKKRFVIAYKDL